MADGALLVAAQQVRIDPARPEYEPELAREIENLGGEGSDDDDSEDQESVLAEALERYTDPMNPEYDPEFDREIRALRPDWFEDEGRP